MTTPNIAAVHVLASQANKETTINLQADQIDNSINASLTKSLDTDVTLTAAEWRGAGVIFATGTGGVDKVLTVPSGIKRAFSLVNNSAQAVTVEVSGSGSNAITVASGASENLYSDGSDIISFATEIPAPTIVFSEVENITGTAYTQVAGDAGKWKKTTNASAVEIAIEANVNAANDEITFSQGGAGVITFVEASSAMTLNSRGAAFSSAGQYSVIGIKFISATEAVLFGDITA